jgi:hypothetical protein
LKNLFALAFFALVAPLVMSVAPSAAAQHWDLSKAGSFSPSPESGADPRGDSISSSLYSSSLTGFGGPVDAEPPLPAAPEPALPGSGGAGYDHYEVAPAATWHQIPFSRIGIGADVSPLGIGIKSAIVLNHYFDARVMGNFFSFDTGRFEVDGFNVDAKLHLASAAASLDWYPFGSVWRVSPGVMFLNSNQLSGTGTITPGTSFQLENQTYYSATANPATGATPLIGTGALGLHTNRPAAMLTGGFGRFIPRSERHWSFPSEFGVVFTGAPAIKVNVTGWACLDAKQTNCSNVGDPRNPIAIQFNNNLQSRLNSWRKDLNKVPIYPVFSYSVVYSFDIR